MKRKLLAVFCIMMMVISMTACQKKDDKYVIGICQLVTHDALDAATKGFKDALIAEFGDKVVFKEQNAANDIPTCSTIANTFVAENVDLIMANATPALQAAANATDSIPVLGTSVTEYGVALSIDNFSGTVGTNVSGTSDLAPLKDQAAMVKAWFPEAKNVGLLFCSAEPNSQYQVTVMEQELTAKRRSVRRYGSKRIDDDVINEIMKVALTAPTSFGHKPVEYVVVRDHKMIRSIGACKQMGGSQINGADTVVVVMVKTADKRAAEFWIEDGAIASSYILLAVEQYDLGACWVHIRNRMGQLKTSDEEIRALLGVPDDYTVLNLVAIGEKGEKKTSYTDKDLHMENVHYETF